jgi:hypothetical protein
MEIEDGVCVGCGMPSEECTCEEEVEEDVVED